MKKENEKYSIEKLYLKEFQFFNGEYDITCFFYKKYVY